MRLKFREIRDFGGECQILALLDLSPLPPPPITVQYAHTEVSLQPFVCRVKSL